MKLALAFVCLVSASAAAGPGAKIDAQTQARADKLFVQGQAAYQQGKYRDAIQLFREGYELAHDPVYLFNIAQSFRKIADCVPAHDYYVKYLDADPKAPNRSKVEQWIFELRPCVDKAREREAEAARAAEEAEYSRKEAEDARLRPLDRPDQPYQVEVDRGAGFRIGGIVLAGVGLLGIAAGATYGIQGNSIESDINTMCTPPNTCQWDSADIQALHDDGNTANTRAKLGYIGGGVALVAGVALYMFGRSRVETVTISPTSGGASVGAAFRF